MRNHSFRSNNSRSNHGSFQKGRGGYSFHRQRKLPVYDPALFIKKASMEGVVQNYEHQHSFENININPKLKENILEKGYRVPTPIQDMVIPLVLEGRDVVGIANTGTGKTAAFLIPLIDKVLQNHTERVLIIVPTRELAVQVDKELVDLSKNLNMRSVVCIGGVSIGGQIRKLRTIPSFVVGTPGRLMDLERQRILDFRSFKNIVLDEVDRMLDMGFIKDITLIVSKLPRPRHSLFFSATFPGKVGGILKSFSSDPITISVKKEPTSANVDQDVIRIKGRDKIEVLDQLLQNREFEKVLVFGRTKHGIDKVAKELGKRRVQVAAIHGNKSQAQRQRALEMFRSSKVQVLLATDIASRGLDISNVTHVINYDLPETYEDYIHRIGRTGRANNKGFALTFID